MWAARYDITATCMCSVSGVSGDSGVDSFQTMLRQFVRCCAQSDLVLFDCGMNVVQALTYQL